MHQTQCSIAIVGLYLFSVYKLVFFYNQCVQRRVSASIYIFKHLHAKVHVNLYCKTFNNARFYMNQLKRTSFLAYLNDCIITYMKSLSVANFTIFWCLVIPLYQKVCLAMKFISCMGHFLIISSSLGEELVCYHMRLFISTLLLNCSWNVHSQPDQVSLPALVGEWPHSKCDLYAIGDWLGSSCRECRKG